MTKQELLQKRKNLKRSYLETLDLKLKQELDTLTETIFNDESEPIGAEVAQSLI